jgi:hypothetical protein
MAAPSLAVVPAAAPQAQRGAWPRLLGAALAGLGVLALVGCAHPINVEPDAGRLAGRGERLPIPVSYHLPQDLLGLEVTTPGGGGDSVRYKPYAAIATGYRQVLSQTFQQVSAGSSSGMATGSAEYLLTPSIVTTSGGSNFFTWPPETFSVDLTTSIRDKSGRVVATPRVVGVGAATTSERISDHGFSGRRAFEDALRKMEVALREWGQSVQRPAKPATAVTPAAVAERLKQLQDLRERSLISDAEYETKRKAILADL